jgi:hypothetical protein
MPENQTSKPIALDELPDVVTSYLSAHRAHDTGAALTAFTRDATVIDAGTSYNGTPAIENWLNRSSTEYTYTVELTAAHKTDATRYTAPTAWKATSPAASSTCATSSPCATATSNASSSNPEQSSADLDPLRSQRIAAYSSTSGGDRRIWIPSGGRSTAIVPPQQPR